MKKGVIILIVIAITALVVYLSAKTTQYTMTYQREGIDSQWSNVTEQYRRQAGLIPNLARTIEEYTTLDDAARDSIAEAHRDAVRIILGAKEPSPEAIGELNTLRTELLTALIRLAGVAENHPALYDDPVFRDLEVQIKGIKNRIETEQQIFNQMVKIYNHYIRKIHHRPWANLFHFYPMAGFPEQALPVEP